jgi:hypothetical protein
VKREALARRRERQRADVDCTEPHGGQANGPNGRAVRKFPALNGGTRARGESSHINDCAGDSSHVTELRSDEYWERRVGVKPRVLTMIADNASLRIRGNSLIANDSPNTITYEPRGLNPRLLLYRMGRLHYN